MKDAINPSQPGDFIKIVNPWVPTDLESGLEGGQGAGYPLGTVRHSPSLYRSTWTQCAVQEHCVTSLGQAAGSVMPLPFLQCGNSGLRIYRYNCGSFVCYDHPKGQRVLLQLQVISEFVLRDSEFTKCLGQVITGSIVFPLKSAEILCEEHVSVGGGYIVTVGNMSPWQRGNDAKIVPAETVTPAPLQQ